MKKIILILALILSFFSCESKLQEKEKLFRESIYDSYTFKVNIENFAMQKVLVNSVKGNYVSKQKYIDNYNSNFGSFMGYSNNLDTITNRYDRNLTLYYRYLFCDIAMNKTNDSLKKNEYKKMRDNVRKRF